MCYKHGKEGNFARGCTIKTPDDNRQNKNQGAQFRSLQAVTKGTTDEQDIKDVLNQMLGYMLTLRAMQRQEALKLFQVGFLLLIS